MKQFFGECILIYLRFFARIKLKRIHPTIIGVTGSVGKTSAINALHTIISPVLPTKTTLKGNSESGIPLEILNIRLKDFSFWSWLWACVLAPMRMFDGESYEVLIVEMGVDAPTEPKNMEYLLKIVRPDIGVLLNVAPAHTEQFGGDLQAIAREKSKLVTSMGKGQTAIINSDDLLLRPLLFRLSAKIKTFGFASGTTLQCTGYEQQRMGTKFTYTKDDIEYRLQFARQIFFKEYGLIFAAALLAAESVGIEVADGIRQLEKNYHLPAGRLSILEGVKGAMIIDSSYNASPMAMHSALTLLKQIPCKGKRIAVLGDMRELGILAGKKHKEIGIYAGKVADRIILVGPLMKQYTYPVLVESGFSKKNLFHFDTAKDVGQFIIDQMMTNSDCVLVKGSQNTIFLETVVFDLMKDKQHANRLLCRQSPYWDRVRTSFFKGK